jgi:hypothetical protein
MTITPRADDDPIFRERPTYEEPYRAHWRALSPRQRLRRAWRLRRRIADLRKLHDQKLFPRP